MRLNLNAPLNLNTAGVPSMAHMLEQASIRETAPTAITNFDLVGQAIHYYTANATTNWTLNVRGNSGTSLNGLLQVGQSVTIALLVTNGASAYYQTGFRVDDAAVTIRWSGGTTPIAGNANSIDIYSITIFKTGNASFLAIGALTRFA
jgi:hypothetical protein